MTPEKAPQTSVTKLKATQRQCNQFEPIIRVRHYFFLPTSIIIREIDIGRSVVYPLRDTE